MQGVNYINWDCSWGETLDSTHSPTYECNLPCWSPFWHTLFRQVSLTLISILHCHPEPLFKHCMCTNSFSLAEITEKQRNHDDHDEVFQLSWERMGLLFWDNWHLYTTIQKCTFQKKHFTLLILKNIYYGFLNIFSCTAVFNIENSMLEWFLKNHKWWLE